MNSVSQFTHKSYFNSTQANTTQQSSTQFHNPSINITYDDLDFLFDSKSRISAYSQRSTPMDIELDNHQIIDPCINKANIYECTDRYVHCQPIYEENSQVFSDFDFMELNEEGRHSQFDNVGGESQRMIEENIPKGEDEEDIDMIFPDLPDDPKFQFPTFRKPNLQPIQRPVVQEQPLYQPQSYFSKQPSTSLNYQPSFAQSCRSIVSRPDHHQQNQHQLMQMPPLGHNYQSMFPSSNHHQLSVRPEQDPSYQNIFKFRQMPVEVDLSFQDSLVTAHRKMFMFYRHLLETLCKVTTLHGAIGHIVVSMRLTKEDIRRCTGVDKSAMHFKSGRRFLASCLSKIILAINAMNGPQKDRVWSILSTCS